MTAAMKLNMLAPWKENYDKPRQCIKKQRHHFADKCAYSQSHDLSYNHVQMCELEYNRLSVKELLFLNFGVVEKYSESTGQQEVQASES